MMMKRKTSKRKKYITTLQRLKVGEWYIVDCYIFRYAGRQLRPDLDSQERWYDRMSINHSGCYKKWDEFTSSGWFWKGEIAGCKHLPDYILPLKYKNNETK